MKCLLTNIYLIFHHMYHLYLSDCTSLTGMFILFKIRQKETETVTCGRLQYIKYVNNIF